MAELETGNARGWRAKRTSERPKSRGTRKKTHIQDRQEAADQTEERGDGAEITRDCSEAGEGQPTSPEEKVKNDQ